MFKVKRPEVGLLILRLSMGIIFFLHGWMKLAGGQELFVREMLAMVGWQMPNALLWLVALAELLGGLALILGLFSRWAAVALAVEMIVVLALFHFRQGFFIVAIPNVPLAFGFEFHVALVGGLICVALSGSGRWALEAKLSRRSLERGRSGSAEP